jgi:small-conductance mechanosensitive channel
VTGGGPVARLFAALLCALVLAVAPASANEAPADPAALIAGWERSAERSTAALEAAETDAELRALRESLDADRAAAREVAAGQRRRIDALRRQLDALGPPPEEGATEESSVAATRRQLTEQIAAEEAVASAAQLAETRFNLLLETVAEQMRERLRNRLLTRGPTPLDPRLWLGAARDLGAFGERAGADAAAAWRDPVNRAHALDRGPVAAIAFLGAALLIVVARKHIALWVAASAARAGAARSRLVAVAVIGALARIALPLAAISLVGFGVAFSKLFGETVETLVASLGTGLLYLVGAYALSAAFYAPDAPSIRLSQLPDKEAGKARTAVMWLASVLALDSAVVGALDRLRFAEGTLIVANFVGVLIGASFLWRLKRVYERVVTVPAAETPSEPGDAEEDARPIMRQVAWLLRGAASVVAVAGPLLAAAGYFAAARDLMLPSIRTVGVIGLGAALFELAREIAVPRQGETAGPDRPLLLRVTPVLAGFAVFLGGLPLLAMAWGASWSDVVYVARGFVDGVDVGGVRFSPIAVLTFVVVFGVGYVLTDVAQRVLRSSVLPQMGVAKAGRSALSAVVRYIGVTLAVFVAIGAAGLDLSNLAIVAGALSVGVGFGLQAIVNNFVSGLILLIERPIKVGDWIQVNGVHGTVQKINVRSTEIETFDRSTYIVPNADLIAQPVTNFTHTNLIGRMIVPVRISYDADIRRAEKILRDVTLGHPMTLRRPAPQILFRAFGQDGYEFEIRAFLRDVNFIFQVMSDVQFTVAERFAAEGIEVPVARRDVRIRSEAADAAEEAPPTAETPPGVARLGLGGV